MPCTCFTDSIQLGPLTSELCRHTGFIGDRSMVPRAEEMPHAVVRQAKCRHGDHRVRSRCCSLIRLNRRIFAQSACFLKNVGTSHSSSADHGQSLHGFTVISHPAQVGRTVQILVRPIGDRHSD